MYGSKSVFKNTGPSCTSVLFFHIPGAPNISGAVKMVVKRIVFLPRDMVISQEYYTIMLHRWIYVVYDLFHILSY